jgi:hypothetical protein
MNWLIESLFYDVMIHVIGCPIARLVLPLLSLNKIGVQPLHSSATGFNAFGYRHDDNGRLEIESTIAGFIGLVILVVALFSFSLLIRTVF